MSTLVKVQPKGQTTIPHRVRSAVGLVDGDLVEVKAVGKKIVITPQLVMDRTKFPSADDEYTQAQRRFIDARLAKSDEDIRQGRGYGPFDPAPGIMDPPRIRMLSWETVSSPLMHTCYAYLHDLVKAGRAESLGQAVDKAVEITRKLDNQATLERQTAAYFKGLTSKAAAE